MLLLIVLLGCAPKPPPPVFAEPPPAMVAPELVELPPADVDDCPAAAAMNPGKPMPYADAEGRAACRAQVVPPRQVLELVQGADLGDYWGERARICQSGRLDDRAYCEYVASQLRQENGDLRREIRWQKAAVPAAGVVGFITGALIATAIARIP